MTQVEIIALKFIAAFGEALDAPVDNDEGTEGVNKMMPSVVEFIEDIVALARSQA